MSNEETIARELVNELRPWLDRIKRLEEKIIDQAAELRVLKELTFNLQKPGDAKAWDGPWPAKPGFKKGYDLKLGTN
jgi:hypothetical protein